MRLTYTVHVNALDAWQRREVPPWCFITCAGKLETPFHNQIWIPQDARRSLDIFWDGRYCRAHYFDWHYGQVYRYQGPELPTSSTQWHKERYRPPLERELLVVSLASAAVEFLSLVDQVKRPEMEIGAIMQFHGYNGCACAIHRYCRTKFSGCYEPP